MSGAALLFFAAWTARPGAVQESPAPVVAPDALRAARLAEDRKKFETVIADVDRFGHADAFAARAREMLKVATERFVPVSDGWFTDVALSFWLDWNVAEESGAQMPALDRTATDHPYAAIVDLNRQLRAHGIDFLLVTFPSRPQLYPELMMDLPTMDGFAGMCQGTSRFVADLNAAGVEVMYLAPEFVAARYGAGGDKNDQLFLRYNQHWTPRGAELTAKLLAERMTKYPWYTPGTAKAGVDFLLRDKEIDVNIVWGGGPKDAKPERMHAHQVLPPPGRQRVDANRPSSPIVLLAGSFADFHGVAYANFTSQLYRFSGWQIDKVNPKGGVEDACREALAKRSAAELEKKKLVIWLVSESNFRPGPMWRPMPIFGE